MTQEIEDKLRDLRGILGNKADRLRLAYLFETDPEAKRSLESTISVLHAQHFSDDSILLLPPPADISMGEYPLGTVQYNGKDLYPFGLRERELPQHVIVAGRSGSGKSNAMLVLAKQFIAKRKSFLLFSFKREYRDLLSADPALLLFTGGRDTAPFTFNPLILPKGTDRETWINLLAEAICSVYFLGEGSVSILRKGLMEVYARHPHPKIVHLKQWLDRMEKGQRRESDWLASTRRAIDAMCFGPLGQVLNSDTPLDFEKLLDKQVILELDNFNDDDRTFIVQSVMRWVYRYALENFPRNDCRYLLMVDEAHHVFLKRAADLQGKETYSDAILRMVRECSVGFVLADQHPSLISLPALGNTFTTIGMNLKTRADVLAIGNAMLLADEQKDYLGRLPVGTAIVKLQDRHTEPFVVRIPLANLARGAVTDETIASRMAVVTPDLTTDFRDSMDGTPTPPGVPPIPQPEERASADLPEAPESPKGLSELERAFLVHVFEHPFTGTSSRYRQLMLSTRHGTEVKDALVTKGYLTPVEIHLLNNRMVLFELTEKATAYLQSLGYHPKRQPREGGIEHRYGVFNARRYFENLGYATATEVKTPDGHFIDLVATRQGEAIACEIETGSSDILNNARSAFAAGYKTLHVLATNYDAVQIANRLLAKYPTPPGSTLAVAYLLPQVTPPGHTADAL